MSDPKSVESVAAALGTPLERSDPTLLGPYTVLRRLGRGGMGVVYLARTANQRLVAIKVIRSDIAGDPAFRARFRQEAATARRVARFCTAEVLDADPDAEQPYLVTEYINGPTLAAVVTADGPLHSANLERLAVGVGAALTAIHGAGVVHQDLKPANVLMSQFGPRVIDFGIARSVDAATRVRQDLRGLGTPAFMAPEQVRGPTVTAAADIFAWGGVVAFAGTGRCAFGEGTVESVLYRVAHAEPDLGGLDPELRPFVERAMSKDPADRPSATELLWSMLGSPPAEQPTVVTQVMRGWAPARVEPANRSPARTSGAVTTGRPTTSQGPATSARAGRAGASGGTGSGHTGSGTDSGHTGSGTDSGHAGTNIGTHGPPPPLRQWIHRPSPALLKASVALLTVLVAVLVGFLVVSSVGSENAAADVTREPVDTPGPNPFLPPVGTDAPGTQPPPDVGRTYRGNTQGLYGGTPGHPSCDIARMAGLLQQNPDRETAWSGVLGIRPQDSSGYLRTLTPVILRTDTYVTNHRFVHGGAVSVPAVLQAGTAVLVDEYGTPVTKCGCGNPLTRPSSHPHPTFTGPVWSAFSPTAVTVVERAAGPLVSFTLVDLSSNQPFVRPVSTTGGNDQAYTPQPSATNPAPSGGLPSGGSPSGGSPSVEPSPSGAPSGGESSYGSPSVEPSPNGVPSGGGPSGGGPSYGSPP